MSFGEIAAIAIMSIPVGLLWTYGVIILIKTIRDEFR